MYYAYQEKMDYLLFWDDDEYPVACVKKNDEEIEWKMQDNVIKHIEYMEKEIQNLEESHKISDNNFEEKHISCYRREQDNNV